MSAHVDSGIDRLETIGHILKDRRIGLMTNPTGINHNLRSTIDILHENYRLTALMGCEHGIRGDAQAGDTVEHAVDPETGVMSYSVYGKSHRLSQEMLDAFDVFVFDIQEVGVRFYTYLYSLSYAMEECAKAGKPVVVLDRINPIGGIRRAGTILDTRFSTFVGDYELPTRTGITIGEYARYVKDFLKLDLELHVVPVSGWERAMYLDDTDLPWVAPSPNCHAFSTMLLYPGTCVFEGTNLSEGRGTTQPFEFIGAPWVDALELEKRMNALSLPGVHFRRMAFTPMFSKHSGKLCLGVQVHILDRDSADIVYCGLKLVDVIRALHPEHFEFISWDEGKTFSMDKLLGTDAYRVGGLDADQLLSAHEPKLREFSERIKPYLLY